MLGLRSAAHERSWPFVLQRVQVRKHLRLRQSPDVKRPCRKGEFLSGAVLLSLARHEREAFYERCQPACKYATPSKFSTGSARSKALSARRSRRLAAWRLQQRRERRLFLTTEA